MPLELSQFQNLYVILETIRPINLEFLKNIPSKKVCLDIGDEVVFQEYDGQYISHFLEQVNMLLLNGKTTEALYHKLGLTNDLEFFSKFNFDLLIKTDGSKPVHFLFNNNNYTHSIFKQPQLERNVVDNTRCWRCFLLSFYKSI